MTTAAEYHRYRLNTIERISMGCIELDNLLRGGIETKAVTQFYDTLAQERLRYVIVWLS
jgi:RecA/RadA recombinase